MTWFWVDDQLADHRKTRKAGTAAMGLWVMCGSWCAGHLTDGFVPQEVASRYGTAKQAERLIAAGYWEPAERNGEPGFSFVNWSQWQRTRAQVERQRAATRERVARHRKQRQANKSEEPQVSAVGNGVSNADAVQGTPGRKEGKKDAHTVTRNLEEPQVSDGCNGVGNTAPLPKVLIGTYVSTQSSPEVTRANEAREQPGKAITGPRAADAVRAVSALIPASIPLKIRTQLAQHAADLLAEGIDGTSVSAGLAAWLRRPDAGPGLLAHLVSDAVRAAALPAANSGMPVAGPELAAGGRGAKAAAWLAQGAALAAEDESERPFLIGIEGGKSASGQA